MATKSLGYKLAAFGEIASDVVHGLVSPDRFPMGIRVLIGRALFGAAKRLHIMPPCPQCGEISHDFRDREGRSWIFHRSGCKDKYFLDRVQ